MVELEESELKLTLIACVPDTDKTEYTQETHRTEFYLLNNTAYIKLRTMELTLQTFYQEYLLPNKLRKSCFIFISNAG